MAKRETTVGKKKRAKKRDLSEGNDKQSESQQTSAKASAKPKTKTKKKRKLRIDAESIVTPEVQLAETTATGMQSSTPLADSDASMEMRDSKRRKVGDAECAAHIDKPLSRHKSEAVADQGGWPMLEKWLREGGALFDDLEVRRDPATNGLGVFARKAIAAGEVAFTVPTNLMLTAEVAAEDSVVARVSSLLREWGEKETPQFLISLRLCLAKVRIADPFHAYASSLPEDAPGAACWPDMFREFLATTTLQASLAAADAELEDWMRLTKRVANVEPSFQSHEEAFQRNRLQWARGMIQSRQFPSAFSGGKGAGSFCMVPLLDLLNHKETADISLRVGAGRLECVCNQPVQAGQQIWNNYGSKANNEMLLCYGFACESNESDTVTLGLASSDSSSTDVGQPGIQLTVEGIPQDVIDSIEEEQNTAQFVALLRAVVSCKKVVKDRLEQLPKVLNFTVCKGPVNRARRQAIAMFLEGQLRILEASMANMQTASDDVGEQEDDHAGNEEEEEEEELTMDMLRRRRKRKRRRR